MDLVSLETSAENEWIKKHIVEDKVSLGQVLMFPKIIVYYSSDIHLKTANKTFDNYLVDSKVISVR